MGGERVDLTDLAARERDTALRNLPADRITPLKLSLDHELLTAFLAKAFEALYVRAEYTDGLRLECNWCSTGDYVWADGEESISGGAFDAAIAHLVAEHPKQFEVQL